MSRSEKKKGFVLRSNCDSVARGQPSLLAILEMVLASAALLYIVYRGWRQESSVFAFIITSIFLAPFALIKNKWSISIGLNLYKRVNLLIREVDAWRDKPNISRLEKEMRTYACFLFFLCVIPLILIMVRASSTVFSLFYRPAECLLAIPNNWFRTVLVLDIFHAPEAIPGSGTSNTPGMYHAREHFYNMSEYTKKRFSHRSLAFQMFYQFGWIVQWVLLFIPAMIIRFALKSSWLIWSPIIYAAHSSSPRTMLPRERLEYIRTSPIELAIRWIAIIHFIFIISHTAIVLYSQQQFGNAASVAETPLLFFLYVLRAALEWASLVDIDQTKVLSLRLWGLFSVTNIIITFVLWNDAQAALRRTRVGFPIKISTYQLTGLLFIRGTLGIILSIKGVSQFILHAQLPSNIRIIF